MASVAFTDHFYKHPLCKPKDDYDHRPFVATNATGQNKIIEALSKDPLEGNAIVGVGGFFILNIASIRPQSSTSSIEIIALMDRSVRVLDFWQCAEELIRTSDTRQDVIAKIQALLLRKASQYFCTPCRYEDLIIEEDVDPIAQIEIEAFQLEIGQGYSWLSSDVKFQRIKKIFDNGRFFFFQVDLFDPRQVTTVGGILKDAGAVIDTVHLSNLSDYARIGEYNSYASAMQELITSRTHVISSHFSTEFELAMLFLRQKKQTPMRNFLFPCVGDIPELVPTTAEAAIIKFSKLVWWMHEHRPLLKKMCVMGSVVAAVVVASRVFKS